MGRRSFLSCDRELARARADADAHLMRAVQSDRRRLRGAVRWLGEGLRRIPPPRAAGGASSARRARSEAGWACAFGKGKARNFAKQGPINFAKQLKDRPRSSLVAKSSMRYQSTDAHGHAIRKLAAAVVPAVPVSSARAFARQDACASVHPGCRGPAGARAPAWPGQTFLKKYKR